MARYVTVWVGWLGVGTVRFVADAADPAGRVGFDDHEGFLEFHLARPVVHTWAGEAVSWEGWVSTWSAEIEAAREKVRAACECGWHGPDLPWAACEPTEAQEEALMLAWDRHIEADVTRGLAWSQCVVCDERFVFEGTGRPRRYCSDACRQAAYRGRH